MSDTPWPRRLISPVGSFFVLLCFFLPFFTVSVHFGFGGVEATYSGMDLVFNGRPDLSGLGASEATSRDLDELRAGVSPFAALAVVSLCVGIGLSLGLPSALARWRAGASAGALAWANIVVNQVWIHSEADRGLREELAADPLLIGFAGVSYETMTESGFWVTILPLTGVIIYHVVEIIVNWVARLAAPHHPPPHGPPPPGPPPGSWPGQQPPPQPPPHGYPTPPGHPTLLPPHGQRPPPPSGPQHPDPQHPGPGAPPPHPPGWPPQPG